MQKRIFVSALVGGFLLAGCGAGRSAGTLNPPPPVLAEVPPAGADPAQSPAPGPDPQPTPDPAAGPTDPTAPGDPAQPGSLATTPDGPTGPGGPDPAPGSGATGPNTAPAQPGRRQHVDVRGLYMSGWITGSDRFYELVDYMQASGLNAVVIDIKDDDGHLSWGMEIPLALEIGANGKKVANIEERIQYLKERNIYVIGRLVVYADPLLGEKRPDLAIHRPDGSQFVDRRGIRWPDPYNQQVWEYNVAIAKAAAAVGFDEIQFDYIRFPEHRIEGYNYKVPVHQRADAILDFLRYAKAELEPLGVFVAADVFGLTTSVAPGDDMEIGQIYEEIAEVVDYILPMVYPSHYAPGTYGVADPNADPGKIVYESLVRAQKRTWGIPVEKHRPWIQDFDLGKDYTARDIEAQIKGLAEAGIYQWILWDPHNRYTRDVNYNVAPRQEGEPEWRREYRAQLEATPPAAPAEGPAAPAEGPAAPVAPTDAPAAPGAAPAGESPAAPDPSPTESPAPPPATGG